jgi:hypothetical protein
VGGVQISWAASVGTKGDAARRSDGNVVRAHGRGVLWHDGSLSGGLGLLRARIGRTVTMGRPVNTFPNYSKIFQLAN